MNLCLQKLSCWTGISILLVKLNGNVTYGTCAAHIIVTSSIKNIHEHSHSRCWHGKSCWWDETHCTTNEECHHMTQKRQTRTVMKSSEQRWPTSHTHTSLACCGETVAISCVLHLYSCYPNISIRTWIFVKVLCMSTPPPPSHQKKKTMNSHSMSLATALHTNKWIANDKKKWLENI